jgi:hypothetical protein
MYFCLGYFAAASCLNVMIEAISNHLNTLYKLIRMTSKYTLFFCLILACLPLSGCAGANGQANGNNGGFRASTDIFKW